MDFKNFILNITDIDKKDILDFLIDWEGKNIYIPKTLKNTQMFTKYNKNFVDKIIKSFGGKTIYIPLHLIRK